MNLLLQPLKDLEVFQLLQSKIKEKKGAVAVNGIVDEQKLHLAQGIYLIVKKFYP